MVTPKMFTGTRRFRITWKLRKLISLSLLRSNKSNSFLQILGIQNALDKSLLAHLRPQIRYETICLIKTIRLTIPANRLRLTVFLIFCMAGLGWPCKSYSALWSGRELLKACNSTSPLRKIQCDAYLAGAIDASKPVMVTPDSVNLFCTPAGINMDLLKKVILSYLRAQPENLNYPASALAILALREKFPCK